MKKGKMIVGSMALVLALGAAFAFKSNSAVPGNLFYWTNEGACVAAPCATFNEIGNPCEVGQTYIDESCGNPYPDQAWTRDGGSN